MRRTYAIVMLSALFTLSLTACGSDDTQRICYNVGIDKAATEVPCDPTTLKALSTIPMTTTTTSSTTSAAPTTTAATTTTPAPTTTPSPTSVYVPVPATTTTTTTAAPPPPPPTSPSWYVGEDETTCTAQEVSEGTNRMSSTVNVTLTNSGGNSTLAFSGKPDFPLTGILVTYGAINTDGGFHGYPVVSPDGATALNGGHIFAAGDNPSNVTIASGGSLTYAGLCFS